MKTYKSQQKNVKPSVLFSSIATFILSIFLLTSCSETESIDGLQDDTALIDKIELASKTTVSNSSLPTAVETAFTNDLADSYIEKVQLADGLGFKVSVATDNEAREESKSDIFFSIQGRQLTDNNEQRGKKRRKCFEFVFPIDFIMPDDSSITLNSKEDWTLIRTWYQDNPTITERPELVFPVDITLKEDGSVQTLLNREELIAVKQNCRKGKDKRKCFKLVLPVTFTMPDNSEITVTERADFRLIREWHKENPTVTEKGTINFPIEVEFRDGTTATITDQTEFNAAKDSCRD